MLSAGSEHEFEAAFAAMARLRVGGLFVNSDPYFGLRREQLAALAARYAFPAIYSRRTSSMPAA